MQALTVIILSSFLGWRAHSITSLLVGNVKVYKSSVVIAASRSKTEATVGLPSGVVRFSRIPEPLEAIKLHHAARLKCNNLFDFKCEASLFVGQCLKLVAKVFGKHCPTY